MESLPFTELELNDLKEFQPVAANWSIADRAICDHTVKHDLQTKPGTGVLVNQPSEEARENLLTTWEHSDLELKISVMMPKGSNSGIYLQGRYEIQLFDSWMVKEPRHADCGGIYQRWDDNAPEGQKGFEGHPPRINAAKAPGLWQHFYIDFRAPKFDEQGNKIENARFAKVIHNGMLIHENVELTGPTRASVAGDEVARAPLMLQGDHGPVAFKDISYKRYFREDSLTVSELQYTYYDLGVPLNQMPDFDTLEATSSGTVDRFDAAGLAQREDYYAFRFSGKLNVEKPGDYLFHSKSDDGSKLYIDGDLVVDNDFNHGMHLRKSGFVTYLESGEHDLRLDYYNNTWNKGLVLLYEGPELKYRPLLSELPQKKQEEVEAIIVDAQNRPEMIRGFVNYRGEKRTHVMAVGHPEGIHYAVDLDAGTLLKGWRGDFADVTAMWHRRGNQQLLQPLAASVEGSNGPIIAELDNEDSPYPTLKQEELQLDRYELDDKGIPQFFYRFRSTVVSDELKPAENQTLKRILKVNPPLDSKNLYCRIAAGDFIEKLQNGYYNIGGDFYVKLETDDSKMLIRKRNDGAEMLFPAGEAGGEVQYSLLW